MEVFGNNNPVWNENLHFDILKGIDKLKVEVNDVFPDRLNKRELIGMCEIDLASLSEEPNEIDQMKKDKLYDIGNGQQIRLSLQWIYSKVKLLEDILVQLRTSLETDIAARQEAEDELAAMEQPFETFMVRET